LKLPHFPCGRAAEMSEGRRSAGRQAGRSLVRRPHRNTGDRLHATRAERCVRSGDKGGVRACACGEIFGELRVPCAGGLRHRALSSHTFLDRAAAIITLVGLHPSPLSLGASTITSNCLRVGEIIHSPVDKFDSRQ